MAKSDKKKFSQEREKNKRKITSNKEDTLNRLRDCLKEKDEYLTGWQRSRADFLNYKKGEAGRIKAIIDFGNEELLSKLLPVLDSFQRAEDNISSDLQDDSFLEGILQIKTQLKMILEKEGIKEIEAKGKKFDPNFHEIVGEAKVSGEQVGTIIEEVQKGYTLAGKVIRPAKVKIAG